MKRTKQQKSINQDENEVPAKRCQDFAELKGFIENLFNEQTAKFEHQNVKIMEALATQNVLTKSLIKKESLLTSLGNQFPIMSDQEMIDINDEITEDNKAAYVAAIKEILRKNVYKNFEQVICEDVVYMYNIEGTHNKKSLRNLQNLFCVLKNAVKASSEMEDVEGVIRKAMQLNKKRKLKKILKERKDKNYAQNNSANSTDSDDG